MSEMVENAIVLLSDTTVTTNLATTGNTTLYTVRTGKRCILTEAWLVCGGNVAGTLECSIGISGSELDFVASTTGDNMDAEFDVIQLKPITSITPQKSKSYAAAAVLVFDVIQAGAAVSGRVFLFGFEYDA